jgi:hypothetical protein
MQLLNNVPLYGLKYSLLVAAMMLSGAIHAQKITVSSKVIDKKTKEPLSYASVWIKGKPIGTITNLQGEFDFHIPEEYRHEVLVVTTLGYEPFEAPVGSFIDQSRVIELQETAQVLNEVIVVSDSITGGDILHIALS